MRTRFAPDFACIFKYWNKKNPRVAGIFSNAPKGRKGERRNWQHSKPLKAIGTQRRENVGGSLKPRLQCKYNTLKSFVKQKVKKYLQLSSGRKK